jgi:hypothetical protein
MMLSILIGRTKEVERLAYVIEQAGIEVMTK